MTDGYATAVLPVVADVVRNGVLEGRHYGSVVALGPLGEPLLSVGDVNSQLFPRSSLKPLQALGMLRSGLGVDGEELAIACSSHSGEPAHIAVVERILAAVGLSSADLFCVPDLPLHEPSAHAILRAGGGRDPVHMNCSGKHAAMLATCVVNGWDITSYKEPAHPLQLALRSTVAQLCGAPVEQVAVDGCGAPLLSVSLTGLARAFAALVTAQPGSHERRVADAMRAHPRLVGGTGRDVSQVMERVPGLLAKDGAEGVYAAAAADGTAIALKIDDGGGRARMPVLAEALIAAGVASVDCLADLVETPVLGGGVRVGAVRALPLNLS